MNNKLYSFDWDDNIFHMPTKIKMDKKVGEDWYTIDVEPAEFALIRGDKENYRIRNNDPNQAFDEFVDFGPRGSEAFLNDIKIAIGKNDFGPSWEIFINCLKQGKFFSIVTSRSHEYSSIRKGIEYIINNLFTKEEKKEMYISCCGFLHNDIMLDSFGFYINKNSNEIDYDDFTNNKIIKNYLNYCKYYGVGLPFSNDFKKEFEINDTQKVTIQEAKKIALDKFIKIAYEQSKRLLNNFSVGFSDDDKKTIEFIKEFFKDKSSSIPEAKLLVYDTSDRTIKGGVKSKYINGNLMFN